MALRLRSEGGKAGCIADLVIGGSLFERGQPGQGLAEENRAAASSDPICEVHAETNDVPLLYSSALCEASPGIRELARMWEQQAADRPAAIDQTALSDQVSYRMPTARLMIEIVDAVAKADDQVAQRAICTPARMAPPGERRGLASQILVILGHMLHELPPNTAPLQYEHSIVDALRILSEAGVPRDDLVGRLLTFRALVGAIDRFALLDPHPRALSVMQGDLEMDLAGRRMMLSRRQKPTNCASSGLPSPAPSAAAIRMRSCRA